MHAYVAFLLFLLGPGAVSRVLLPHAQNQPHRNLILGGSAAPVGRYPYICSLRTLSGQHFCGATLIADRLIVTAAYCASQVGVVGFNATLWCGIYNDSATPIAANIIKSIRTTVQKCYEPQTFVNDIALMELSAPSAMPPIPGLLRPGQIALDTAPQGYGVTALGWGRSGPPNGTQTANSGSLQQAYLPLVPASQCNEAYNGTVDPQVMFCAGYPDGRADSCSGDSGGPVIDQNASKINANGGPWSADRLVGIVSWGIGCGQAGFPGVYTRIDAQYDWIVQHGFCACTSTNFSGAANLVPFGCHTWRGSPEMLASSQHRAANLNGDLLKNGSGICYVVDPRCPTATPSTRYPGDAWIVCNTTSTLIGSTYSAGMEPSAGCNAR